MFKRVNWMGCRCEEEKKKNKVYHFVKLYLVCHLGIMTRSVLLSIVTLSTSRLDRLKKLGK